VNVAANASSTPTLELSTTAEGDLAVAHARRLNNIQVQPNWQFASSTKVKFWSLVAPANNDYYLFQGNDYEVTVVAGMDMQTMQIQAPGGTGADPFNWGSDHLYSKVKVVTGNSDRTACSQNINDVPMGVVDRDAVTGLPTAYSTMGITGAQELDYDQINYPTWLVAGVTVVSQADDLKSSAVKINFMQGGSYKLCYAPGNVGGAGGTSFTENPELNNVLDYDINVLGVSSPCNDGKLDGCLETERWDCLFGYMGESDGMVCTFNFMPDGGRPGWAIKPGAVSKLSWGQAWDPVTMVPEQCGASDADTQYMTAGSKLDIDLSTGAEMPDVKSSIKTAFTLSACYCPSIRRDVDGGYCDGTIATDGTSDLNQCCESSNEFIQRIGIIYYWMVRVCDVDGYTDSGNPNCDIPYMRVIPQQRFALRLDCPPAGCLDNNENRVRFVSYDPSKSDLPNWNGDNRCQTTTKSTDEPSTVVWPTNMDDPSGGELAEYKVWWQYPVKLNLPLSERLDVCFCNDDPFTPSNWIRVGTVRTSSGFTFASTNQAGNMPSLKYVDYPGTFILYGGIKTTETEMNPYDGVKYSGKALINIISYDRELISLGTTLEISEDFDSSLGSTSSFQATMDGWCQTEQYSETLVEGPSSKNDARQYVADVPLANPSHFLAYGQNNGGTWRIKLAGVVAICYCAMVTATTDECENPNFWLYAGRQTIHGPLGGVEWEFPTEIVVKIHVTGWGFSANDKLRIIPAQGQCTDDNDPDGDISFRVGCPGIDGNGCILATPKKSIDVSVVTSQTSGITIESVSHDIANKRTELSFSSAIGNTLVTGDHLTINYESVLVGGQADAQMSAVQRADAHKLSGEYAFSDPGASTMYMVPHTLTQKTTSDGTPWPKIMTIPTAFADDPVFTFANSQGQWVRRNRIDTEEELKGEQDKQDLRLCWGVYDETSGTTNFYKEAGKVSFESPPPMASATINPTTKSTDSSNKIVTPFVIAFSTSAGRKSYATGVTSGNTQLMLRFLDVSVASGRLLPRLVGDTPPDGGSQPAAFPDNGDEITDQITAASMSQSVCGSISPSSGQTTPRVFPCPWVATMV
jgi:hypothetical protein